MAPNLSSSSEERTTDKEKESSEEVPQVSQPRKPVSQKSDSHAESESESESEDDSDSDTENAMVQNVKPMEDSLEKTAAGNRGGETEKESTDMKGRKENTDDMTSKSESEDDSDSDSDSDSEDDAAIVKPMEVSPAKSKAGPSTQLTSGKRGGETEEESNGAKRLKEGGSGENTDGLLKMVRERSNTEPVNRKAKSSNADSSKLAAGLESELGDRVEIEKQDKGKSWFSLDWALGKESIAKFAATKGLDHMKESKRIELKRRWRELHIAAIKLIVEQGQLLEDQTMSLLDDSEP